MVGENDAKINCKLEEMLSTQQLQLIIKECTADSNWKLNSCQTQPAMDGLAGFLGDHIRATLNLIKGEEKKCIRLFVKRMPLVNKPKADFIDESNFFRREQLMFTLFEEMDGADGPNPWRAKAYIYTDTILVMPDLTPEGYSIRPFLETLDLPHVLLTVNSLARFHAAFTNYETRKIIEQNKPYSIVDEYGDIMQDPTFRDTPWLRGAGKLAADFLAEFSVKFNKIPDLEAKLVELFIEACDNFKNHERTLNVFNHKDLWVNNVMFKYENGMPINSLLIDFQCSRYGPPAFDLTIFLYLTTSRRFREEHELEIFRKYFEIFSENLEEDSEKRLQDLKYNETVFLEWCEKSRMFAVFEAIGIFPYVLMDPKTAENVFDDPKTYDKYLNDRSKPVIAHARKCQEYRERQLEVAEEFVERYILKEL